MIDPLDNPNSTYLIELATILFAHINDIHNYDELDLTTLETNYPSLKTLSHKKGFQRKQILSAWNGIIKIYKTGSQPIYSAVFQLATLAQSWAEHGKSGHSEITLDKLHEVFELLYLLDAVYDLVSGKLHRLDPVIGEFGCQWRVPFVMDAYDVVIANALEKYGYDNIQNMLREYENARTDYCIQNPQSCVVSYIDIRKKYTNIPKNKNKPDQHAVQEIYAEVVGLINVLTGLNGFMDLYSSSITTLCQKIQVIDVNPLSYLKLCKMFTACRVRTYDVFGLSGVPVEDTLPFPKKTTERYVVELANYSRAYMTYVAETVSIWDEETFLISFPNKPPSTSRISLQMITNEAVDTYQKGTKFKTHVFYAPLRTIFAYQCMKQQPIIIDVRRLMYDPALDGTDQAFTLNGARVLYFEPTDCGSFIYVENPSDIQRKKAGMCVECFSIVRSDYAGDITQGDNKFHTLNFEDYISLITSECAIVDLILCGAVLHHELPGNISVNNQMLSNDGIVQLGEEIYVRSVGGEGNFTNVNMDFQLTSGSVPLVGYPNSIWNVITERRMFRTRLINLGVDNPKYKDLDRTTGTASRTISFVPFSAIHIYGCTFAVKQWQLEMYFASLNNQTPSAPRIVKSDDCKEGND